MTDLVTRLPKDIQWNIIKFLSLPIADIIREKIQEILQNFIALTPEQRRKYDRVPNINTILKYKSQVELYDRTTGTTHTTFNISFCQDLNTPSHLSRSDKTLRNYGIITRYYKSSHHLTDNKTIYKKLLTDYLDANQVPYKPTSQLRTFVKLIMSMPNTEEKYKIIKTKTKTKTKKVKLILVD
jgi:hypothetical protein